jgi:hypothetical protein
MIWSYRGFGDVFTANMDIFLCGVTVAPLIGQVVRRRMMMGAAYKNTLHALRTIATKEGKCSFLRFEAFNRNPL